MTDWTESEIACLRRLWTAGIPARIIASRLQKEVAAVARKAQALGLPDRDEPPDN
jgi:hypothetical protein